MSTQFSAILVLFTPCVLFADVFSWEADAFPDVSGWDVGQNFCDPAEWVQGGSFFQRVDICPGDPPLGGQQSSYQLRLLD